MVGRRVGAKIETIEFVISLQKIMISTTLSALNLMKYTHKSNPGENGCHTEGQGDYVTGAVHRREHPWLKVYLI